MYQTGFFEQKKFHLSTWGCPRPTRGERHLTCIVSYIGKNFKNSPKIHLWTDLHDSGCKRKLVVQGQRRGQRSRSWEVKVTLGPIFCHFSAARIWGSKFEVKVKGQRSKVQGQMSNVKVGVKVKVKGFKFHGLMSKTRASVSQKPSHFLKCRERQNNRKKMPKIVNLEVWDSNFLYWLPDRPVVWAGKFHGCMSKTRPSAREKPRYRLNCRYRKKNRKYLPKIGNFQVRD